MSINKASSPILCFKSKDDAFDFSRKIVEESKDWSSVHNVNFLDRYVRRNFWSYL